MLKSTGVVRRLDDLGRVVMPKELRRTLGIDAGDPVEFFVDGERVVIKKYTPGCMLCGSLEQLHTIEGKQICMECRIKIGRTLGR
jgi:transcriptional pleiotropic regulator of transition state genes